MKRLFAALFLFCVLAPLADAQAYFEFNAGNKKQYTEMKAQMPTGGPTRLAVPGSGTNRDVQVTWMCISNNSASSATVTVQDADGADYALFTNVVAAPNSAWIVPLPTLGLKFKGGIYVSSSSGTVVIRLQAGV